MSICYFIFCLVKRITLVLDSEISIPKSCAHFTIWLMSFWISLIFCFDTFLPLISTNKTASSAYRYMSLLNLLDLALAGVTIKMVHKIRDANCFHHLAIKWNINSAFRSAKRAKTFECIGLVVSHVNWTTDLIWSSEMENLVVLPYLALRVLLIASTTCLFKPDSLAPSFSSSSLICCFSVIASFNRLYDKKNGKKYRIVKHQSKEWRMEQ